jgi:hypothetical protein
MNEKKIKGGSCTFLKLGIIGFEVRAHSMMREEVVVKKKVA